MIKKITYALAIILMFLFFLERTSKKEYLPYLETMLQGNENSKEIFNSIKSEKIKRGIPIFPDLDIHSSGLIGEEFTGITTTMGNLDSKILSTNPHFTSYFIRFFKEKNLNKGDYVAINMSSSFPGLNISLISALDTLELKSIIINSVGASMYGANNENYTFLEMANDLKEKGLIKNHIDYYSYGGDWDIGGNFDSEIKDNLFKRLSLEGVPLINDRNYKKNYAMRTEIYSSKPIKAFVNVGGNIFSTSLEEFFSNRGIPTLEMLNIKPIASSVGIPISQKILGHNFQLYKYSSNHIYDIIILICFLVSLFLLKKYKRFK